MAREERRKGANKLPLTTGDSEERKQVEIRPHTRVNRPHSPAKEPHL